jgi:hypothetical protein
MAEALRRRDFGDPAASLPAEAGIAAFRIAFEHSAGRAKRSRSTVSQPTGTFHLPLWLQAACADATLWAFNAGHLTFLESDVRATDRRRLPNVNRSAASRLPGWFKSAKNRQCVLHAIAILTARLRQC